MAPFILNLGTKGREWSDEHPGQLTSGKEPWCPLNMRVDGAPEPFLMVWRKVSFPYQDLNPGPPASSLVTILTALPSFIHTNKHLRRDRLLMIVHMFMYVILTLQ